MLAGVKYHVQMSVNPKLSMVGNTVIREVIEGSFKVIGADLLIVSVPVFYRLVLNCGYAGYAGGLRVIEDIYDRVLDTYR